MRCDVSICTGGGRMRSGARRLQLEVVKILRRLVRLHKFKLHDALEDVRATLHCYYAMRKGGSR